MRPPDEGENEGLWLERAREARARAPFGLHTHWTAPDHARPTGGDPAALVREQGRWLESVGLRPTFFCGGGWYIDEGVAAVVADLGYADCTATSFRPGYLGHDAPHLQLDEPTWLDLGEGRRLLEVPTTHSIGMLARGVLAPFPRAEEDGDGSRRASAGLAAREDDVVREQPCVKRDEAPRDQMQLHAFE